MECGSSVPEQGESIPCVCEEDPAGSTAGSTKAPLLFARRGALWVLSLRFCLGELPFFKLSLVQGSSALPLRQNLVPKLTAKIFPAVAEA